MRGFTRSVSEDDEESGETPAPSSERKSKPSRAKPKPQHATKFWEQLGEFMGDTLGKEIAALKARIAELEERPAALDYKGVFMHGRAYKKNEATSHKSSLWVALTDHPSGIPGDANSGWQMAEKEWKK